MLHYTIGGIFCQVYVDSTVLFCYTLNRVIYMEEKERLLHMTEFEEALFAEGYSLIAGVDEAGRGPLAGDVYAAAVILPRNFLPEGLNDSKKLSEKKREALYDVILENALAWAVGTASAEEIDTINILNATHLAMYRALSGLKIKPEFALIDGNPVKGISIPHNCIVKGDGRSLSIAAASVIAKVSRDRYMQKLDEMYPGYGFAIHKGYGTKAHKEAIFKKGPCEVHRKSFLKKWYGDLR